MLRPDCLVTFQYEKNDVKKSSQILYKWSCQKQQFHINPKHINRTYMIPFFTWISIFQQLQKMGIQLATRQKWRIQNLEKCSHEQMESLCVLVYEYWYSTKKVNHTLHLSIAGNKFNKCKEKFWITYNMKSYQKNPK